MAMLNNQMVYIFSFSHLGNCGTGVDKKSLQLFPGNWNSWIPIVWPIFHGEILHGLLRCDLFNPQSCLLLKKPPTFLAEFEVFWWFFVPFPSIFQGFCAFFHGEISTFFGVSRRGSSRQEKDKGPSKASRESASLAAERRLDLEVIFFRGLV